MDSLGPPEYFPAALLFGAISGTIATPFGQGRGVERVILAIDIGNSSTTIGLFGEHGGLRFRSDLTTRKGATRDECAVNLLDVFRLYGADIGEVTGTIIASVVPPLTAALCGAVEMLTGRAPLLMGPGVKTGLNIKADIHAQMGADIVACSVAAIAKYPGPILIVDEGCVILPGVQLSLEALSDRAAELPHISISPPASILGHNTVDAMRSGVVYGNASMVDGMIARLEAASQPAATVVGTGQAAPDILKYCQRSIVYDADLLLCGLYLIYQKNTEGKQRKA